MKKVHIVVAIVVIGLILAVLGFSQDKPGMVVDKNSTVNSNASNTNKEISEEDINKIIDELPEWKATVPITSELKNYIETKFQTIDEANEKMHTNLNMNLRRYKNYWIIEDKKNGIGFRFPYDTKIEVPSYYKNSISLNRPENAKDSQLICSFGIYQNNQYFDQWKENFTKEYLRESYENEIGMNTRYVITSEELKEPPTLPGWKVYAQAGKNISEGGVSEDGHYAISKGNTTYFLSFGLKSGGNYDCTQVFKDMSKSFFAIDNE